MGFILQSCSNMAIRSPMSQLYKHFSPSSIPRFAAISTQHAASPCQMRSMATVVPPVTQDATSSKGPTAMVFMNMGGPSTTDEVGDFLSKLFVRTLDYRGLRFHSRSNHLLQTTKASSGRWRSHPPWPPPIIPRTSHLQPPYSQNKETICSDRRRFSNT